MEFFFFEKEKQGMVHNIITVKDLNISILQLIKTIFLHIRYSVCMLHQAFFPFLK